MLPSLLSELHHKKIIPVPTPSPETVATPSPMVKTILHSSSRKGRLLDSVITNQKIELMDATVKIEEMPLTVPCLNHGRSSTVIKTEATEVLVNNLISKKSSVEKVASNKKSPRKQIPTRGEIDVYHINRARSARFIYMTYVKACEIEL